MGKDLWDQRDPIGSGRTGRAGTRSGSKEKQKAAPARRAKGCGHSNVMSEIQNIITDADKGN